MMATPISLVQSYVDKVDNVKLSSEQLMRCLKLLDLTSLNDDDDTTVVQSLCEQAVTPFGQVAAICINPTFVKFAKQCLSETTVNVATVANFPAGMRKLKDVLTEINAATDDGADEIDVVFPYQTYLMGQTEIAHDFIAACAETLAPNQRLKVIIEISALGDLYLIEQVTELVVKAGADFVKTSTGKLKQGANKEAVAIMLLTLKQLQSDYPRVGLKVSGGVKSAIQALEYLALADLIMGETWATPHTFRFGASSLLLDIMRKL